MPSQETLIDIYKEILYTNKSLAHFVKANRRAHDKLVRFDKFVVVALGMGIAYIAISEIRHDDQKDTIKRLSKEIAELKKQKGE